MHLTWDSEKSELEQLARGRGSFGAVSELFDREARGRKAGQVGRRWEALRENGVRTKALSQVPTRDQAKTGGHCGDLRPCCGDVGHSVSGI